MKSGLFRRRQRRGKWLFRFLVVLAIVILCAAHFSIGAAFDSEDAAFAEETADVNHGWNLILVNSRYKIPRDWEPELTELSNGQSVDSRIYPALQQMFDDMRAQGYYPVAASGYRTAERQQELMNEKVRSFLLLGYSRTKAEAEAKKWVSEVGYSEHQTGLAVDINADSTNSTGEQVYSWLAENAWKYGFILRYPEDKTKITGIDYEPWHYRYVGADAAAEIHERGICLEEYISMLD